MTQAARPQTPWLIPPGDMTSFGRSSFTVACRGHEKMGEVLSYFVYEASWQAKNEGIDTTSEDCDFILIERDHKHILARVSVSENSLTTYIKQLTAWGFLSANAYCQRYMVYFQTIQEAVNNPPEVLPKKPRGKAAPKKEPSLESQAQEREEKITKLQSQISNLGIKITKLRTELSNLGFTKKDESTPGHDLEAKIEPPRILLNLLELKEDSRVASADTESDGAAMFLSQLRSFDETLEEIRQNGKAPLSVSPHKREGHSQEEPVVKSADTSLSSGAAHTSTPNDITSQEEALQEIPTEVALTNVVPVEPTKTPPTHKTVGKGKSKIPEPVPLCSSRVIREAIDAIRGYALEEVGAIIHQNNVLKEWCQKHTLEEYQHVIEHVTKGHCANKKHQFWREGTNLSSFFNADKLAELTPGILSELGHIPKPVAPPEVAPKEEKIIGWQPQRRVTPPKGVTVTYA